MSRLKRPSPALVISIMALVAAIVVPAYAALTKKDKKTVKNIASAEITKRAPGLAVASANTANSANTAGSAQTAEVADTLDGADFCRTDGVVTEDDDDPGQVLCTQGALSIVTSCGAGGGTTQARLDITTTAAGTFGRTPAEFRPSTAGPDFIVIVSVSDTTGVAGPTVQAGTGDFSAGVPSTNDQLNGVATARAEATATDEGTCDFTLGAIN